MRRYWIATKESVSIDGELTIDGDRFHHVFDVCRQSVGSKFEVLPGDGKAYFVEVQEVQKKSAIVKILEERKIEPLRKPYIHMYLSLPKFSTFESTLEKLVELGVYAVTPVFSDFSFVKSLKDKEEKKFDRWKRIIESATQQSGRGELLQLRNPLSLKESIEEINRKSDAMGLFPYEGASQVSAQSALAPAKSNAQIEEIGVFVGSEGGFSQNEVESFEAVGMAPMTLGPQVLRVETACVAITSVIKYELGLLE